MKSSGNQNHDEDYDDNDEFGEGERDDIYPSRSYFRSHMHFLLCNWTLKRTR